MKKISHPQISVKFLTEIHPDPLPEFCDKEADTPINNMALDLLSISQPHDRAPWRPRHGGASAP